MKYSKRKIYKCDDGYIGDLTDCHAHLKSKMPLSTFRHHAEIGDGLNMIGYRVSRAIYELKLNGVVVFTGTAADIAKRCNVAQSTVSNAAIGKTHSLNGKYQVVKIRVEERDELDGRKTEENETLPDMYYRYAIKMLNKYGNTVIKNHAKEIMTRLNARGIKYIVEKYNDEDGDYYIITKL